MIIQCQFNTEDVAEIHQILYGINSNQIYKCVNQGLSKQILKKQMSHVMLAVFARPLSWIEQIYDHQGLYDAIPRISIRFNGIKEELAWLFVIQGTAYYHQMPFSASEFIHFVDYELNQIRCSQNSICAVLTKADVNYLNHKKQARENDKKTRFIKTNIFYPYYLEQQYVKQFAKLVKTKKIGYNKCLNWKDQDGTVKAGIVYEGVVSVEYQWKRNIQICEITRGMFLTNNYIKDELEQIQDYQLQQIDQKSNDLLSYPKFKFISKSQEAVVLVFNLNLINQSPYNINLDLKKNIKSQFQKYSQILKQIIGNQDYNRLHRNKKSIIQQLKKHKYKDDVKKTIDSSLQQKSIKSSPIMKAYISLQQEKMNTFYATSPYLPPPPKQFSKTVFATIIDRSPRRLVRSNTARIQNNYFSNKKNIHNTWVEASSKKKQNLKSFSTLVTLSTYRSQKMKRQQSLQVSEAQQNRPQFFVPDQFVKRKLKIKYQGLIKKMRDTKMTFATQNEQSLAIKMQRLQAYIDSKRILAVKTLKNKHKLLRDRVQY